MKKHCHLFATGPAKSLAAAIFAVVFIIGTSAFAQSKDPVSVELKARKVIKAGEKEAFEPASKAVPGDAIQYDAIYKNTTAAAIRGLQPMLPIPAGTEYIADSAKPAPTEASLNGKDFESFPIKRKVKTADGKEELREVPASQIRALRWKVGDLDGGVSTTMVARVRVSVGK